MDWLTDRYMQANKIANIVREIQNNPAFAILYLNHQDSIVQIIARNYIEIKKGLSKEIKVLINVIFNVEKEALDKLDK